MEDITFYYTSRDFSLGHGDWTWIKAKNESIFEAPDRGFEPNGFDGLSRIGL
jgi:hypothetical protein